MPLSPLVQATHSMERVAIPICESHRRSATGASDISVPYRIVRIRK